MWKQMFFIFLLISAVLYAQDKPGAISTDLLSQIQHRVKKDNYTKAMMHAVSENSVQKLAFNRKAVEGLDFHFAHKIESKSITNQKSSGRCWLFTALNTLRPGIVKKHHLKSFEFSENYLFFWDQFEKANLFLEGIIATSKKSSDDREVEWLFKNSIGDGGVWNMMVDLVEKYGAVPKAAMPETYNSDKTSVMSRLLRQKLRQQGMLLRRLAGQGKSLQALREQKIVMLGDIYRILAISLGEPPNKFSWRYEDADGKLSSLVQYTPQSFFKTFVGVALDDYVLLMDDPTKPYYKLYEIKYDRNRFDGSNWTFVNVPSQRLKTIAKASILDDKPLYFSCDVGKQLNKKDGILALGQYDYDSVFGVSFKMTKAERILSFQSGSSHGMSLVGVDTSASGAPTKWLLENSWGSKAGHEGYLIMTDQWFDAYMFRLVAHKKFIPAEILKVLKQKPILLPPWDRMF